MRRSQNNPCTHFGEYAYVKVRRRRGGVAERDLGDSSSHLTVHGGDVWATVQAPAGTRLVRVDPRKERVVASEDLGSGGRVGYGRLVAGGGYVGFGSGDGLSRVAP